MSPARRTVGFHSQHDALRKLFPSSYLSTHWVLLPMEYEAALHPPQGGRHRVGTPWWHPLGALVLLLFVDLDPDLAALRPLGGFFVLRTAGAASAARFRRSHRRTATPRHQDVSRKSPYFPRPQGRGRPARPRAADRGLRRPAGARGPALVGRARLRRALRQHPRPRPAAAALGPRRQRPRRPVARRGTRRCPPTRRPSRTSSLHGHLEPLAAALRARYRVAAGLLWGNAASALAGAARAAGPLGRAPTAARTSPPGPAPSPRNSSRTPSSPAPAPSPAPRSAAAAAASTTGCPAAGVCGDCCFTRAAALFPTRPIWVTMKGNQPLRQGVPGACGTADPGVPAGRVRRRGCPCRVPRPGVEGPRRPGRALLGRGPRGRACVRHRPWSALDGANDALRTFSVDLAMAAALEGRELVHSHTWYANLAGHLAKLLYGIPHVMTAHSLEPLRPWKAEQLGGGYALSSWAERTAIEAADAVIAVSGGHARGHPRPATRPWTRPRSTSCTTASTPPSTGPTTARTSSTASASTPTARTSCSSAASPARRACPICCARYGTSTRPRRSCCARAPPTPRRSTGSSATSSRS